MSAPHRPASCPSFTVMSWNIAAGHGDLARIAETIRASGADVVALQEVDVKWSERSAFVDQADSLAKLLRMNVRFAPIYDFTPRQFGVAILSRYPIARWNNHQITRLSTQSANALPAKAPGFLESVIDVGGTHVRVFNTHLDYRADPSVRRTQVAEMLEIIGETKVPTILAGDLNAAPTAPELRELFPLFGNRNGRLTYPADKPVKEIDYILVTDAFSVTSVRVDSTAASDHRPVIMGINVCRRRR